MQIVQVTFDSNIQDYAAWMGGVPKSIQVELDRKVPKIGSKTKRVVKKELKPGFGVDEGIYKRSFTLNTFSENKWAVGFQVFAKKPHYRLTHLLEDGHRIKMFTPGRGKRTKFGNVGMSFVSTLRRPNGRTNEFVHILPGQTYGEQTVIDLYKETTEKYLGKGMKK